MKKFIIIFGKTSFIPTCTLMIAYCIFYQYIASLPYLFIIKLILLMSFVLQFIGWIISLVSDSKNDCNKQLLTKSRIVKFFYLRIGQIITQAFCYYFAIYLVFMLDKKSVFYNYLVLLLFGLLLGYRIAMNASDYLTPRHKR